MSYPTDAPYIFTRNDPFDWSKPVEMVVPQLVSSREYMRSIREFAVPEASIAVWFLGQNGFIVKDSAGPLIGIDLYLTDGCAARATRDRFRMDRQLPVFVEPEDLDVDVFITTHSHRDHADPDTIARLNKTLPMQYVGPFDSLKRYEEGGVDAARVMLVHPSEEIALGPTKLTCTFALPTDNTDLNHTGVLLTFANGVTFFNTGDTAWAERLPALVPSKVDICAVCINGGFHNLDAEEAAAIVMAVQPRVAIPCHYDMMINNVGSPEMFRAALVRAGSTAQYRMLRYYEPWVYTRAEEQQ